MALTLISGDSFASLRGSIYKKISERGIRTGRHIVLVPDRFTLSAETDMLKSLGLQSSFNISVMSFSRFADTVLGKKAKTTLNQQTGVMLLKKVIYANLDKLGCFKSVAMSSGYAGEMYAVITDIRNSGISVDMLRGVIANLSGTIKAKSEDILVLYEGYMRELATDFSDIGSRLETLATSLQEIEEIGYTHFYLTDFHSLSRIKLNIVERLLTFAASVTFAVAESDNTPNARIYPRYLTDFLLNAARRRNVAVYREYADNTLHGEKKILADRLYSYFVPKLKDSSDYVRLYKAESIREEVNGAAMQIRRLIVESGYRYKDIAVVCDNIEGYGDIISEIFADYEIPYYMDIRSPLSLQPLVKIYKKALEVIAGNYASNDVLNLVKESFFPSEYRDKCAFENYVVRYNIDRSIFMKEFTLGAEEERIKAERVRLELIGIVDALTDNDALQGVRRFLDIISAQEACRKLSDYLALEGRDSQADVTQQTYDRFELTITQVEAMFANSQMPASVMHSMLLSALESINISTIPQYIDSVYVGVSAQSDYNNLKSIFILGAGDNTYPSIGVHGGILAAPECRAWAECDVVVTPTHKEKAQLDKFQILQLLLKPSERIYMSYVTHTPPSNVYSQISKLFNIHASSYLPLDNRPNLTEDDYALKIGTKRHGQRELARYYAERRAGRQGADENIFDYLYSRLEAESLQNISQEIVIPERLNYKGLAWKSDGIKTYVRVSALETYFSCPFRFFAQHVLSLKERDNGQLKVADIGSFIHRVLELFFKDREYFDLDVDESAALARELAEKVLIEEAFSDVNAICVNDVVKENLVSRCIFTLKHLVNIQNRSELRPIATEMGFGLRDSELGAIRLQAGDKEYYMRGVIDRVDGKDDYRTLVDYKTASKVDFSLKEIYYGERVQLLLYLKAYTSAVDCKPLGVFYLPLPCKYDTAAEGNQRFTYTGYITDDEYGISLLDKNISDGNTFLPIKTGKNGLAKSDNLISYERLKELTGYAEAVICRAIEEIEDGFCAARPLNECKDTCPYLHICRAKNLKRREKKAVSKNGD